MDIAIIGATGLVGREIIKVLQERDHFSKSEIIFVASHNITKRKISFYNKEHPVVNVNEAIKKKPKYVLFSAGSEVAKKYAKEFKKIGSVVIDNSSAFRMNKEINLIVPEINGSLLTKNDKIISNPNCSTIQLVLPLHEVQKQIGIKRLVVSTYQSVSGSGKMGLEQLKNEQNKESSIKKVYPKNIFNNVIPQCDEFLENFYTKEEEKIINETNKIFNSKIRITSTAVRIPTTAAHSESVNMELSRDIDLDILIKLLSKESGVVVQTGKNYMTPIDAKGSDKVFVSRIRKDYSKKNSFNLWIVADPLRKGAATNAVQILEYLINLYKG